MWIQIVSLYVQQHICKATADENVPHLEMAKLVLVQCNFVIDHYQQDSEVLYTFIPNKSFGQLLDISPRNFIF